MHETVQKSHVFNDPAKPIEVMIGQTFVIKLDSNSTTGYQWQLAKPLDTNIVELLSTEYRVSETSLIGAGGKEIWKFKAVGRGEMVISMKYIHPWEKDVPPVKNVQFQILVYH